VLYDWDALDELPLEDDDSIYEIWSAGWVHRSSKGTFSLSPFLLGEQWTVPWESVFAWVVQRKRRTAQAITVWRIRIASYIQEGCEQRELSSNLETLRAQITALLDVADVGLTMDEMAIVKLRMGLTDERWPALRRVAALVQLPQERVRYLEVRALHRLRKQDHLKRLLQHYLHGMQPPQRVFTNFSTFFS
ncbi:MAG TPA: hypothetical protein VFV38_43945, partial [Ktedonobacteraceae bacterium]|nr:hypothetical protein [Ktedonobacteraceae bacterium]